MLVRYICTYASLIFVNVLRLQVVVSFVCYWISYWFSPEPIWKFDLRQRLMVVLEGSFVSILSWTNVEGWRKRLCVAWMWHFEPMCWSIDGFEIYVWMEYTCVVMGSKLTFEPMRMDGFELAVRFGRLWMELRTGASNQCARCVFHIDATHCPAVYFVSMKCEGNTEPTRH